MSHFKRDHSFKKDRYFEKIDALTDGLLKLRTRTLDQEFAVCDLLEDLKLLRDDLLHDRKIRSSLDFDLKSYLRAYEQLCERCY
jgi:hypothetical protein